MTYLDQVQLSLGEVQAGEVIPFPLFPIGEWKSAKYPSLPLTRELAETLIANHEAGILGTEPMVDSSGKHDTSSPAAAWLKRLYIAPTTDGGEMLMADGKLTDLGADLLTSEQYRYLSVEIDEVTDNRSGVKTPNVLKSATLTNTPVLRIMPAILDAPDSIAVALSEITAAGDEAETDPVQELLDDLEAVATKLDASLKGKKGIPSARAFLREVRGKVSAHKLSEDSYQTIREALESALGYGRWVIDFSDEWVIFEDGGPGECIDGYQTYKASYTKTDSGVAITDATQVKRVVEYVPATSGQPAAPLAVSEPVPAVGKGDEGEGVALSAAEDVTKGRSPMDPNTLTALKLAEGADEAAIDAAVLALAERAEAGDAALSELATVKQEARATSVEHTLSELISGGHVAPGQKDAWLKLAEAAPEQFDAMAEAAKAHKIVELSEHGAPQTAGDSEGSQYANASVELAETAKARAKQDGISYASAERIVLSENTELAGRYEAFRAGKDV